MNFRSLEIADEHNIHYVTDDFQALNYTLILLQLRNPFITGFYLVKSNPDLTNFWNYL